MRDGDAVARLREGYAHFDSNRDGLLLCCQFARFFEVHRSDVGEQEQRLGYHKIDEVQQGTIDFDEFLELWDAR